MSQTITWSPSKSFSPVLGADENPLDTSSTSHGGTPRIKSTPAKIQRRQHFNVEKAYQLLNMHNVAKRSGRWCVVNFVFALLFYFQACQGILFVLFSWEHSVLRYLELLLSAVFTWNVGSNFYKYIKPQFKQSQVELSNQQKALLGISKEDEKLFSARQQTQENTSRSATPIKTSKAVTPPSIPLRRSPARTTSTSTSSVLEYSPSRQTSSLLQNTHTSPGRSTTPLYSQGSGSRLTPLAGKSPQQYSPYVNGNSPLLNRQGTPSSNTSSPSVRAKVSPSRMNSLHMDDEMLDYESLEQYMKKEEESELRNRRANPESPKGPSFWSYGRAAYEYIPTFGTYQLATRSQSPSLKDDDDTPDSPFKNDEMWKKLGINKCDVDIWNENIRKWLAQTVLEPLVREINNINSRLTQMGSPELHIGTISHSSLQNLGTTKYQHLPSLPSIIPYLMVSTNQEYLVNRLKELATGGCLRLYRWDTGGTYKGKAWNSDLPSDAQIISHLFCAYMDTHLPSNPRYPEGKSFTGLHFLKTPSKPSDKKSSLCLYQSRTQKPHFKVLVEDAIWELPKGRNNLFHSLVVFLYYAKKNYHGMLERVNLGSSGINVLWVLDR